VASYAIPYRSSAGKVIVAFAKARSVGCPLEQPPPLASYSFSEDMIRILTSRPLDMVFSRVDILDW
jgi:hypothetical protein